MIGDGTTTDRRLAVNVVDSSSAPIYFASIFAGHYGSAAVTSAGTLYVWGNLYPGDGSGLSTVVNPKAVTLTGVTISTVQIGYQAIAVLTTSGAIYTWGENSFGQLGVGDTSVRTTATLVSATNFGGSTISQISMGEYHLAFVSVADNKLWMAGASNNGRAGLVSSASVPTQVSVSLSTGDSIAKAYAVAFNSILLTTNGKVLTVGLGDLGVLGNGGTSTSSTFQSISTSGSITSSTVITQVFAGSITVIVKDSTNVFHAWGTNDYGQACVGSSTSTITTPTLVNLSGALSGVTISNVAVSRWVSVFQSDTGVLYGCGANQYLGSSSLSSGSSTSAVLINGGVLSGKTAVEVSAYRASVLVKYT